MKKFSKVLTFAVSVLFGIALSPIQKSELPVKEEAPVHVKRATDPLPEFSEPHLVFHYYRHDNEYDDWKLWIWGQNEDGADYYFTHNEDEYGKYLFVPVDKFADTTQINIIIKYKDWDSQTPDINIQYSDYIFDLETNAYHFYLIDNYTLVYESIEDAFSNQVLESYFTSKTKVKVVTNNKSANYTLKENESVVKASSVTPTYSGAFYYYTFTIDLGASFEPNFDKLYSVEVGYTDGPTAESIIGLSGLFDDPYFAETMTYDGDDLGVSYTPEASTFKAWAPTVSALTLRLYDSGTPVALDATLGDDTYVEHDFVRATKGVWEITVTGDLHGKYYTFVATHPTGTIELTDPYAKGAGVNGIRGMIVDFSKTNPLGWEEVNYPTLSPTEIIPYELHVADLTSDPSWNGTEANRKKFLGLIEEGTTFTKDGVTVKTGFDHIKELGVNALQIIPFYDQQNDELNPSFNWGYNPQNYDVLEGSYSSNPHDGLVRIREFKQVVQAYAKEDIRIIMDVVYNHVASISAHSFTKLVPGYYFRYGTDGSPDNSSGVGNVTASERIMMERYMRDSTAFWVKEYKIGGFRFDLMGLHTTVSMQTLYDKVKEIRSDILIYGEAWDMDQSSRKPTLFHQANVHKVPGIGAFNDQIRDAFVSNDRTPRKGWVQMPAVDINSAVIIKNKLRDGMLGKIYGHKGLPTQTINYAAVHDNYTLFDKITLAGSEFSDDAKAQQSLQTDSLVLLAQGVSFIHAGSELLRSKDFDYNSYQSSYEINSIKWADKVKNLSIFENYQKLINLKRNSPAFQYTTRAEIDRNVTLEYGRELSYNDNLIVYTAKEEGTTYTVLFYSVGARLRLNEYSGYTVVLDTTGTLDSGTVIDGQITLTNNTTLILKQNDDGVIIPPSSEDPGTSSEPGETTELLWLYITIPLVLVVGAAFTALFILRKRKM